jgi:DNA-binding transcriptional ArsR family regulator
MLEWLEIMDTAEELDMKVMQLAAAKASRLLKALANPNRLLLLYRLTQGEYCVGVLEAHVGVLQPTLSQQLAVLRHEGLVATRRDGKKIFYSIASRDALAVMQVLYQRFCSPSKGEK